MILPQYKADQTELASCCFSCLYYVETSSLCSRTATKVSASLGWCEEGRSRKRRSPLAKAFSRIEPARALRAISRMDVAKLSSDELDQLTQAKAELQIHWAQELLQKDSGHRCPVCGVPVRGLVQWFPGAEQRYYFNVDGPDPCGRLIWQEIGFDPATLRETGPGPWGNGPSPRGWWENSPAEFYKRVDVAVAKLRCERGSAQKAEDKTATDEVDAVRFSRLERVDG